MKVILKGCNQVILLVESRRKQYQQVRKTKKNLHVKWYMMRAMLYLLLAVLCIVWLIIGILVGKYVL